MTAKNPTHPSANLRDALEETGWSVNEFANRLGVNRNTASRLLNERCGISPEVALALERIGWSNAEFWMRRQAYYELALARLRANSKDPEFDDLTPAIGAEADLEQRATAWIRANPDAARRELAALETAEAWHE